MPVNTEPDLDRPATASNPLVLLVEDEDAVRRTMSRLLERRGYTLISAGNSEEAIAICAAEPRPVSVLVTDVVMPGLSGPELARELRQLYPQMRIIYMSGFSSAYAAQAEAIEPFGVFLEKPFMPQDLFALLQQVMEAED